MNGGFYLGCVVSTQTSDVGAGRLLDGPVFARQSGLTQETCRDLCSNPSTTAPDAPYIYFAIEFSSDCRCGNNFLYTPVPVPQTECSSVCAGTQQCGGTNRMSLFRNLAVPDTVSLNSLIILARTLYVL